MPNSSTLQLFKQRFITLIIGLVICSIGHAQWFAEPLINPFNLDTIVGAASPTFGDLDNDGDFDIMSGNGYYLENIGTVEDPDFAPAIAQPFGLDSVLPSYYSSYSHPEFGDIDGDNDLDIITSLGDDAFLILKNDGDQNNPHFVNAGEIFLINYLTCVSQTSNLLLADIDNDQDLDFILGTCDNWSMTLSNSITLLYENIGTGADFIIDTVAQGMTYDEDSYLSEPALADLDNDGDLDVLVGGNDLNDLYYYENSGDAENMLLDSEIANPFELDFTANYASPAFADLDNDGDQDLLIGLSNGTFMYYEHDASLSINDHSNENQLTIYPNPTQNDLAIESDLIITEIQCFDQLGRAVMLIQNPSALISIGHLHPGLFILKFTLQDGSHSYSKVLKE